MKYDRERAFYRIPYPTRERPTLSSQGLELVVHDVSESGLKFATVPGLTVEVGQTFSGTLRFGNRGELRVEGKVVWVEKSVAAVELLVKVPFARILSEQRYLRSRYKLID